jgi:hypothetical protein
MAGMSVTMMFTSLTAITEAFRHRQKKETLEQEANTQSKIRNWQWSKRIKQVK